MIRNIVMLLACLTSVLYPNFFEAKPPKRAYDLSVEAL